MTKAEPVDWYKKIGMETRNSQSPSSERKLARKSSEKLRLKSIRTRPGSIVAVRAAKTTVGVALPTLGNFNRSAAKIKGEETIEGNRRGGAGQQAQRLGHHES